MPSSAHILPNIANVEKHLQIYSSYLTKPQYHDFKDVMKSLISGKAHSVKEISRVSGKKDYRLYYFFNNMVFNDENLLQKSVSQLNHKTPLRSTKEAFLILDFTSTAKTGTHFEWSDFIWNEETEESDICGYETLVALEYDQKKNYHKALGMKRFYHEEKLFETEYSHDDFLKKPVVTSHLLTEVKPLTHAREVLVDGEFINCFLVNRFKDLGFSWTGRIKKSLLATYRGKTTSLEDLTNSLLLKKEVSFKKASYRNQKISVFSLTVTIPSLSGRKVKVAVCKNKKGKIAFIGSSVLTREAKEIIKAYSYRWEIEVYFKAIKGNLFFSSFLLRFVGANSRWQYLVLIAANIIELIRLTKIVKLIPKIPIFKKVLKFLFTKTKLTMGLVIKLIRDLKNGGQEIFSAFKCLGELSYAKKYLFRRVIL